MGSVAILPPPHRTSGITGASLFCTEQRWSFLVRLAPEHAGLDGKVPGEIRIGDFRLPVQASPARGQLAVPMPTEALEAIKAGAAMDLRFSGGLKAEFALAASRVVIDTVAPRCSPVDMSPFERLDLSGTDVAVAEARPLLASEARLFREATGQDPSLAARKLDLADGKALLMASLCGSTSYYGESGCSLFGYARQGPHDDWRLAYDTEGVRLYLDVGNEKDGFPAIVTLPMTGPAQPSRWIWTGAAYEIHDDVMAQGHPADGRQAQ